MKRIIYTALLLLTTVSLFSCAKSSSSEAQADANDNIETDSEMPSNSFQIVNLNKVDANDENLIGKLYTIKKGDDFVMFDNQADYSEFCSEMALREAVLNEWYHLKNKNTSVWPSADEKISMFGRVSNLIDVYQNDKNDISDPIIFEAIDKVFFKIDYDPSNLNFNITKKLYEEQHYKCNSKHISVLFYKFKPESDEYISGGTAITLNDEVLPPGAIIAVVLIGLI